MAKKQEIIKVQNEALTVGCATICIEGDTDLVLNKMNARTKRQLTAERNGDAPDKRPPNKWEDIITAVHWRDFHGDEIPDGMEDTYEDSTEDRLMELLQNNAPCITAFGLKKSFKDSVVRNNIDTYSTALDASTNVLGGKGGLVPIKFSEYSLDERLMSPKRGAPVLSRISHFSGWAAEVRISYQETTYSLEQIVNIINLAGFGLGIGSGRSSGYGRYHVVDVK